MKNYIAPAFAASLFLGANAIAGGPAAPYKDSSIDARLNVTVKGDTDVVHFVRDNADPSVFTKAYIIKNVDPYELRTYLRKIVQTRKVDGDNTNVEAVKFTDGTSVLLVSAEDYRFDDTPGAQGIDSIIRELDKPRLVSSSGNKTYIYSPKFRSAAELMEMVNEVGTYAANAKMNNLGGIDTMVCDPGLNLIFFNTSPFSRRTVMEVLAAYDQPYPEIRAKITVYELYAENDAKIGLDFQAWKNNDGVDLFGVGGRFSQNHNSAALMRDGGWNDATYYQFNPKWNTKYLDFLTSKSKAKVLHTSELTLQNNTTGIINKYTQVFAAKAEPLNDAVQPEFYTVQNVANGKVAVTRSGKAVELTAAADVTIVCHEMNGVIEYTLRVPADSGATFVVDGTNVGTKVKAAVLTNDDCKAAFAGYQRGNKITTEASNQFGFSLAMTPVINTKATTLNVKVSNSSLIGYTSDGTPRIQKGAGIDTDFMISNDGTKLVIGGIEKRSVVSVSGGVPILKDLPIIGWIFSTESESTKRSQIVVVAELLPVSKACNGQKVIKKVQEKVGNAGDKNTFGYRQYLIDSDR